MNKVEEVIVVFDMPLFMEAGPYDRPCAERGYHIGEQIVASGAGFCPPLADVCRDCGVTL